MITKLLTLIGVIRRLLMFYRFYTWAGKTGVWPWIRTCLRMLWSALISGLSTVWGKMRAALLACRAFRFWKRVENGGPHDAEQGS